MTNREWFGRVLLAILVINIALAGLVALMAVSRFELDGRFDFFFWLIFIVPAVVVGAFAALTSWLVTVGVSVTLVRLVPTLGREVVVVIALLIPGLLALLPFSPWVQPGSIDQPAQLPEVVAGIVLGSVLAALVVNRTNRAAVQESPNALSSES
jgi:hypothetical protein